MTVKELSEFMMLFIVCFTIKGRTMSQLTIDKIEYTIMLIKLFAAQYQLTPAQAYRYISRYDGMAFIERNYGILHTLSFKDMVQGLSDYCYRKGGQLV